MLNPFLFPASVSLQKMCSTSGDQPEQTLVSTGEDSSCLMYQVKTTPSSIALLVIEIVELSFLPCLSVQQILNSGAVEKCSNYNGLIGLVYGQVSFVVFFFYELLLCGLNVNLKVFSDLYKYFQTSGTLEFYRQVSEFFLKFSVNSIFRDEVIFFLPIYSKRFNLFINVNLVFAQLTLYREFL